MFRVEQTYDYASLTVLCRAARKTVRRGWKIMRIAMWVLLAVECLLTAVLLAIGSTVEPWMIAVTVMLLLLLVFDDKINAWAAKRQMIPGTAHSVTVFEDAAYTVKTDSTETCWQYENITGLCETERYFLFFIGRRHGQCFDKQGFQVGDPEEFRGFIEGKTGLTFTKMK